MDFNEIIDNVCIEINSSENFTNEFKEFSIESTVICRICNMYEEGTSKKITLENINDEIGIISFINDLKPLLSAGGIEITLSNKLIEGVIKDFYFRLRKLINEH